MHQNAEVFHPSPPAGRPLHERTIVWIFLGLIVLPQLLFSTPEYIWWPRLVALTAIAGFTFLRFPHHWNDLCRSAKIFIAALLVVHASSWYGGWQNCSHSLIPTACGIVSLLGLTVLVSVLLEPRWRLLVKRTGLTILLVLLATSLACYFFPMDRYIRVGEWTVYFEPTRLALIWPSRLAMAWLGQIGWEHTNFAALLFGLAMILTLESIAAGNPRRTKIHWWLLSIALGAAVFLTGSRSGWMMIAVALPFVLIRRRWNFTLRALLVCVLSVAAGFGALKIKEIALRQESVGGTETTAASAPLTPDIHVAGLVSRGTAGRLRAYHVFWDGFSGSRVFGTGLSNAARPIGPPIAQLMHEHSSYLATFRAGGFVALAAHLTILLLSLFAAGRLFLNNCRWPLVLLIATLTAILFDHSNVFAASSRYDFLIHWTAVLIPLLLISKRPATAQIGGT